MKHYHLLTNMDHRVVLWFVACALAGLMLGLRYAASEERAYRSFRSSARSGGRRREETVYVVSLKGGN